MEKISYGKQQITDDDIKAVVENLKSDYLTQGPAVDEFEKNFAKFVGAEYAVAVSNATAALHLSALALGVTSGKKVITTPNTFVASANCVRYCGGDVEFVDIDERNYCLDLNKLEAKLKASPVGTYSGVIPVSFAGYPVDLERLRRLATQYNFWIIEDACHAPGAKFRSQNGDWQKTGSGDFADLSVFSFHPVKHIATGEGGMITTKNKALAEKLRMLRSHGISRNPKSFDHNDGPWYYEMQLLGFNYRISDINCVLGNSQLKRIESNLKRRTEIASRYSDELAALPLTLPYWPQDTHYHAFHLYVVQTDNRKSLFEFLKSKDIYCQIHYIPVHQQPYYKELYGNQIFPVAETYYSKCISLPMFHGMTSEQHDYVIKQIKAFHGK